MLRPSSTWWWLPATSGPRFGLRIVESSSCRRDAINPRPRIGKGYPQGHQIQIHYDALCIFTCLKPVGMSLDCINMLFPRRKIVGEMPYIIYIYIYIDM